MAVTATTEAPSSVRDTALKGQADIVMSGARHAERMVPRETSTAPIARFATPLIRDAAPNAPRQQAHRKSLEEEAIPMDPIALSLLHTVAENKFLAGQMYREAGADDESFMAFMGTAGTMGRIIRGLTAQAGDNTVEIGNYRAGIAAAYKEAGLFDLSKELYTELGFDGLTQGRDLLSSLTSERAQILPHIPPQMQPAPGFGEGVARLRDAVRNLTEVENIERETLAAVRPE